MNFRVTQRDIYAISLTNMNSTLSGLQQSNIQAASQKRINQPEDDPAGQALALQLRSSISQLGQYQKNITTATGWLNLADSTTSQVSTVLTGLKELAEQASTGTMTDQNRQQISYQARQEFEQLISLANTTYENQSIFSGQKTDSPAYAQSLWLTANDSSLSNVSFSISGATSYTGLVQFTDPASSGGGSSLTMGAGLNFRYSLDGGQNWTKGVAVSGAAGYATLNLGSGLAVSIADGATVKSDPNTGSRSDYNSTAGTSLWVRPTAQYLGDDHDSVDVDPLTAQTYASGTKARAGGTFSSNVMVRIDAAASGAGSIVRYSYSLDNGSTWVHSNTSATTTGTTATLSLPGGILTLSNAGKLAVAAGDEYVVRPRTANINVAISPTETITVNGVGKDIFGGIYKQPGSNAASAITSMGSNANIFEVAGKFIGYLETNNQTGIAQCVAAFSDAQQQVLTYATNVGGRENRLTTASTVLTNLSQGQTQQLSNDEDVDLSSLLSKLAQQQIAYQAVLKSSSMIMQLSLVSYI
ncbi:MAG: flagellar biosynthesis protein FlgL [Desulfovibrionaceae bacterium]|nr:flagellar biosynthesis protein FlgL [Desulfovibrionaceae bacterium]MBF0512960.1 flagellar biosynthesis protein FlgL [Desulfovibrionaceae bacterium]